jgi:chromosome segregation ATPase
MTFLSEKPPTREHSTQSRISTSSESYSINEASATEEASTAKEVDHTKLLKDAVSAVKRLGASTANADLTRQLKDARRDRQFFINTIRSLEEHRAELLADNEKLEQQNETITSEYSKVKVINQQLSRKVKTLDAMRELLGPVRQD